MTTLRAGEVNASELIQLTSPSLFGEDRIIVLTNMEDAGKEPAELVLNVAVDPAPGIYLIIVHSGGGRQKALVPKLSKISQVHEANKLKPKDRVGWVTNEFKRHGVRPTPDVVHALLDGVGSDLRELASPSLLLTTMATSPSPPSATTTWALQKSPVSTWQILPAQDKPNAPSPARAGLYSWVFLQWPWRLR